VISIYLCFLRLLLGRVGCPAEAGDEEQVQHNAPLGFGFGVFDLYGITND
jgi:hypothetical protein